VICNNCKHYRDVAWKHKGMGCSLAITRSSGDGYGPFYESPVCVHDKDTATLKDAFEPVTEAHLQKLEADRQEIIKRAEKAESMVRRLEQ